MLGLLCLDVVLALYLILNSFALRNYRAMAGKALRAYDHETALQKALRTVLKILCFVFAAGAVFLLFVRPDVGLTTVLSCVTASLFCALYGFAPFSSSLWCITADGVYIYRVRKNIPWSQIVNTGGLKNRRRTFLTLQVKKQAGETFKQVYYSCPLPDDQLEEARQIIRDFMHALDTQRLMKKRREERGTALKDRKFY